ncbi:Ltp family lipoprotein [Mycobacterium asiaticum]|nr:Ltp family lipoprotein [Mycobacterium asiaticum]
MALIGYFPVTFSGHYRQGNRSVMNKKHLTTLAAAALLAISGVAAGGAHAAPVELRPLSPADQQPLSPMSQQNAVAKAKEYLSMSAFSRTGLIDQLEYEGFSTEDATYAVNTIAVDWNQQAAKKAKEYLSMSAFSRSGLLDQLAYEGFTPAQAQYGVAATGL